MNGGNKKKLWIGVLVGAIISILTIATLVVVFFLWFLFGKEPSEITTNIKDYEKAMNKYDCEIIDTAFIVFPEKIPDSVKDTDFYYSYQEGWEPSVEVYLQCTYDEKDYQAEVQRLENTKKQYGVRLADGTIISDSPDFWTMKDEWAGCVFEDVKDYSLSEGGDYAIKIKRNDADKIFSISIESMNWEEGIKYIEEAFEKGAAGCITEYDIPEEIIKKYNNKLIIKVEDSIKALQNIAKYKRSLYDIPVVAVTGSVGKTSTKDIIASVLSQEFNVAKTKGNYNNHLGVPLTILDWDDNTTAAVVEMGMNHAGEIEVLTKIAEPTVAVITNVGTAHIRIFRV